MNDVIKYTYINILSEFQYGSFKWQESVTELEWRLFNCMPPEISYRHKAIEGFWKKYTLVSEIGVHNIKREWI